MITPSPVGVIVCAIDFSSATSATVARAADLARRHDLDRIHLVHVAEIVHHAEDEAEPRTLSDWIVEEEDAAARTRRVAADLARALAIVVVPEFRTGIAWREIVECAGVLGAGLLVVGARVAESGDSESEASVVAQVVRAAPCTVVVVRPETPR